MKASSVIRCGAVAALLAAGSAYAQSLTPVMTDVGLLPAEDRDSVGAVVLENSMVRAQREAYIAAHSGPARVEAVARDADRVIRETRMREDIKAARDEDRLRLREMGAGSIDPR